jgi:hypothetical protein
LTIALNRKEVYRSRRTRFSKDNEHWVKIGRYRYGMYVALFGMIGILCKCLRTRSSFIHLNLGMLVKKCGRMMTGKARAKVCFCVYNRGGNMDSAMEVALHGIGQKVPNYSRNIPSPLPRHQVAHSEVPAEQLNSRLARGRRKFRILASRFCTYCALSFREKDSLYSDVRECARSVV